MRKWAGIKARIWAQHSEAPPPPQLRGRAMVPLCLTQARLAQGAVPLPQSQRGQRSPPLVATHHLRQKYWVNTALQFCLSYSIYQSMYIHIKAKCLCIKIAWRCCNTQEENPETVLHLKHQLHTFTIFLKCACSQDIFKKSNLINIWYENGMKSQR